MIKVFNTQTDNYCMPENESNWILYAVALFAYLT